MSADTPLLCAGNARQLIDEMTDFSFAGGRLIRAELEAVASEAAVVVDRASVERVIAEMRSNSRKRFGLDGPDGALLDYVAELERAIGAKPWPRPTSASSKIVCFSALIWRIISAH